MTQYFTTRKGHQRLVGQLQTALARYHEVCASNEDAAGAGDSSVWHDNFAYEENQRQMHQLARRVRDLQAVLNAVEIVEPPRHPERVCLGCAVRVYDATHDEELRYVIGGYEDSDTSIGRLAYTAPLARTLIGAEEGEVRVWGSGEHLRELEILEIVPALAEEL